MAVLFDAIDDLQAIDFGYLDVADDNEHDAALRLLEIILDDLEELDIWFPEGDLAVRYFLTDPDRARRYLYGPTDVQDGRGLIEKLKELAAEMAEEENVR